MLITVENTDKKTFKQIRELMADEVIQHMLATGTALVDAERARACMTARHGLALIMSERMYAIDVTNFCEENRFFLDPVLGYFRVESQGQPHYDITLRDDDSQRLYLVVVERAGPASPDNPKPDLFWSLNLIIPQVEGDTGPALCLGMDITNNTKTYGCELSGNLYRQPRFDQQTKKWIPQDKLRTLDLPVNIEQACANALKASGFPLHEIRQNRPSPEELRERRRERRWGQQNASPTPTVASAPSLVPASAPTGNGGTPYASSAVSGNGSHYPYKAPVSA